LREETNLTEAVRQAQEAAQRDQEAGVAIDLMEQAVRELLRNGQFEDIDEEVPMLLEEFYPQVCSDETANGNAGAVATASLNAPQGRTPQKPQPRRSPLTNKLGKGNPSPPQ